MTKPMMTMMMMTMMTMMLLLVSFQPSIAFTFTFTFTTHQQLSSMMHHHHLRNRCIVGSSRPLYNYYLSPRINMTNNNKRDGGSIDTNTHSDSDSDSNFVDDTNKNKQEQEQQEVDKEEEEEPQYFGVGEKTMELKHLTEATTSLSSHEKRTTIVGPQKDTTLSSSSVDSVEEQQQQEEKTIPTLHPLAVLKFVAPTLALWIAPPVMSLIDTSVVGRFCGPTDLAALSPGCTLIDSSSYLFMFIATAATNMVAAALATGDNKQAERIDSEALFLALCSGVGLAALVFLQGKPLLTFIAGQASVSVVPSALRYALVRAFGQPFVVMASVARASALARKDTQGPLLSVALACIMNLVGTVSLVKYQGLGIVGAAIGTLSADVAATLFLLHRIRHSRQQQQQQQHEQQQQQQQQEKSGNTRSSPRSIPTPLLVIPTMKNLQRFLTYAAPIFFTILGKSVVYNGIAVSVGQLGLVALAAHQVLLRSFFFWCPVGDSVGMTSQVFLPGILAEEKRTGVSKQGAKRLLFGTGVIAGLIAAALAGLLPSQGAGLFTTDTLVAAALKRTAPILAFCVGMHAIALTCEGMLLAQQDFGFLSISYVTTTVATIGLLVSSFRPSTLGGCWWILALFQGGRALQFMIRNVWISSTKQRSRQRKVEQTMTTESL